MRSIRDVKNLKNKRVLVRVDFNVPIKRGRVLDETRLTASLPTIEYLIKEKAKVVLVTHLGRPDGKKVAALSVKPVAKRLAQLLHCSIAVLSKWSGMAAWKTVENMKPGAVVMLENVRFFSGEEKNDPAFAKELSGLADIFVLDGFAVAHRAAASVAGVAKFLPSYAGLLLEQEISGLEKVIKNPQHPFVMVIGGAKMETKVPVIKNLLSKADHILVGGGIVNTYLKARGYGVGDSLVDDKFKKEALAYGRSGKIVWPVDVVVGDRNGKNVKVVPITKTKSEICSDAPVRSPDQQRRDNSKSAIYDIGPRSIQLFATYIKHARTLVWNGAMGYFEQKPYDIGTLAMARLVASRSKGKAYGVVGGGETLQALEMVGMGEYVDLVSTGGGAMLEFLAGKKLPGVEALQSRK